MEILLIKIPLPYLLLFQLTYCMLGAGYNAVSYWAARSGRQPLAPTSPVAGAAILLVYGICLAAGYSGFLMIFQGTMAVFLFFIAYFGIIKHLIRYARTPQLYASGLSWFMAVAINLYGTLLNLMAVGGRFTTRAI